MAGDNGDARVAALGRETERTARRVTELGARVDRAEEASAERGRMLVELAEQIEALAQRDDDGQERQRVLPSWLAADDEQAARELLADLCEWLTAVYRHYPGGALPSCWLFHPTAVEELLWLRHAHRAAYVGRNPSWRDVADWHDRMRPGVVGRLREAIGGCELSRHSDGAADRVRATPAVPLTAHTEGIAEHWTAHRTPPVPNEQQLSDADQHDSPTHRSRTR